MPRSVCGISLVLLLCLAASAPRADASRGLRQAAPAPECPGCPDQLIVFGDSISDTGLPFGLWSYTANIPEDVRLPLARLGYSKGRWTNGKTWVEYLAGRMKVPFASFAVGGAQVNKAADGNDIQVQLLVARKYWATMEAQGTLIKNNLCVVSAGSNDFIYLDPKVAANPLAAIAFLASIGKGIKDFASELLTSGNCSNLIVTDLPPLYLTPRLAGETPQARGLVKFAQDQVNGMIKKAVADLNATQANSTTPRKVLFVSVSDFLSQMIEDDVFAKKWGQVIRNDTCLHTNSTGASEPSDQLVSTCRKPVTHFFWDELHPTTGGHHSICDGIFVPALIEAGLHVKGRKKGSA